MQPSARPHTLPLPCALTLLRHPRAGCSLVVDQVFDALDLLEIVGVFTIQGHSIPGRRPTAELWNLRDAGRPCHRGHISRDWHAARALGTICSSNWEACALPIYNRGLTLHLCLSLLDR